jgi:hypothetical protein
MDTEECKGNSKPTPTPPVTPTPEPTPIPRITPECPKAGPEICGEEPPPEELPDSGDNGEDGYGNGNGDDASNENGDGDEEGEDIPAVPFG